MLNWQQMAMKKFFFLNPAPQKQKQAKRKTEKANNEQINSSKRNTPVSIRPVLL